MRNVFACKWGTASSLFSWSWMPTRISTPFCWSDLSVSDCCSTRTWLVADFSFMVDDFKYWCKESKYTRCSRRSWDAIGKREERSRGQGSLYFGLRDILKLHSRLHDRLQGEQSVPWSWHMSETLCKVARIRVHTAVHRTNCRASSRTSIWGSSDARYRSAYGPRNIELRAIIRNFHVASKIFVREHSCTRENPKGRIQEQGDWDTRWPTFSCEARQTSRTCDVHWSRLAPPLSQDLVWSKIWHMNEFSCDTECPHQLYLW